MYWMIGPFQLSRTGYAPVGCKASNMSTLLWFASHTSIFLKICEMVIRPVRRTYNHIDIFAKVKNIQTKQVKKRFARFL